MIFWFRAQSRLESVSYHGCDKIAPIGTPAAHARILWIIPQSCSAIHWVMNLPVSVMPFFWFFATATDGSGVVIIFHFLNGSATIFDVSFWLIAIAIAIAVVFLGSIFSKHCYILCEKRRTQYDIVGKMNNNL
jgi:hypothetical protein